MWTWRNMTIDTTSPNLCCRGCEKWICGAQVSERNSVGTAWIMNHVPRRALGNGHLAPPLFPLRQTSPHMAPVLYLHWSTNISSAATLWTSIPSRAMSRLAALLEWQLCFWDSHDSTHHPSSAHNLIQDATLQSYGLRLCPWPLNLDFEPPNWQPNKPSFFLTKHGYFVDGAVFSILYCHVLSWHLTAGHHPMLSPHYTISNHRTSHLPQCLRDFPFHKLTSDPFFSSPWLQPTLLVLIFQHSLNGWFSMCSRGHLTTTQLAQHSEDGSAGQSTWHTSLSTWVWLWELR